MKNDTSIFSNDKHLAHVSEATRQGYNVKVLIRRLHEDEKEKALRFLKSVFGGWRSISQWDWKFKEVENKLGREASNWVVEDRGKIVGHLAFIPMELRVGSSIFPVCQLVDGALSEKYRHGGLYGNLVRQVLLDAKEKGNLAVFGFANRPSYRIYAWLKDFQTICEVPTMFKILGLKNAMRSLHLNLLIKKSGHNGSDSVVRDLFLILRKKAIVTLITLIRNMTASAITCAMGSNPNAGAQTPVTSIVDPAILGQKLSASWSELSRNFSMAIERNSKYLEWRYINPTASYQIFVAEKSGHLLGYVIIASEEKSAEIGKVRLFGLKIGYIVDLVAENEAVIPLLLRAEDELGKREVCLVNCWTMRKSYSHAMLRSMRYYEMPREIGKITLVANSNSQNFQATISSAQCKDVLITLGDSDLV